jgi:hypothetical protein
MIAEFRHTSTYSHLARQIKNCWNPNLAYSENPNQKMEPTPKRHQSFASAKKKKAQQMENSQTESKFSPPQWRI